MRLRPRTALAELNHFSRSDLAMISAESKKGWAIAEEMRLAMAGIVSEFIVASSRQEMVKCLEK
jgi:hypothetical protein